MLPSLNTKTQAILKQSYALLAKFLETFPITLHFIHLNDVTLLITQHKIDCNNFKASKTTHYILHI